MLQQDHGRSTDEDHDVWAAPFRDQMAALPGRVVPGYLEAIEALGLDHRRIPEFADLHRRLGELAGWEVQPIDGMISNTDFFGQIRSRRFPSTKWMRGREELAHGKDPDMFHNFFGHIPFLVDPTYRSSSRGRAGSPWKARIPGGEPAGSGGRSPSRRRPGAPRAGGSPGSTPRFTGTSGATTPLPAGPAGRSAKPSDRSTGPSNPATSKPSAASGAAGPPPPAGLIGDQPA